MSLPSSLTVVVSGRSTAGAPLQRVGHLSHSGLQGGLPGTHKALAGLQLVERAGSIVSFVGAEACTLPQQQAAASAKQLDVNCQQAHSHGNVQLFLEAIFDVSDNRPRWTGHPVCGVHVVVYV